jgi:crotonobetainyl-CoA:carnitine CoA-transferase CaiB-like acyl-CoA transferase
VNLKDPKGKEALLALAAKADVIIESFRPGVTKRLGIDYESIRLIQPGIIYCSITAYGQDDPAV